MGAYGGPGADTWDLDLDENAYAELREWFRRFDPMHQREDDVFTQLGYIDVQHLASRIQGLLKHYDRLPQSAPRSRQSR